MIQINSLCFKYNNNSIIFNDLSIQLNNSKIIGIYGQNGIGKTTFLNLINGLIPPYKGEILIDNTKNNFSANSFLRYNSFTYPRLKGIELLNFYSEISSNCNNYICDNIIEISNLINLPLNKFIEEYSDGMKQKLYLLATLIPNKSNYIFDEPFNFLDLISKRYFLSVFKSISLTGKSIIFSEHNIDLQIENCDNILFLTDYFKYYDKNNFSSFLNIVNSYE